MAVPAAALTVHSLQALMITGTAAAPCRTGRVGQLFLPLTAPLLATSQPSSKPNAALDASEAQLDIGQDARIASSPLLDPEAVRCQSNPIQSRGRACTQTASPDETAGPPPLLHRPGPQGIWPEFAPQPRCLLLQLCHQHPLERPSILDLYRQLTVGSTVKMSKPTSVTGSESEFEFIETPKATAPTFEKDEDCGVRTTKYPCIKNAPLPAEGPGSDSFNNKILLSILGGVPLWLTWKVGGGIKTFLFFALVADLPLLAGWWLVISAVSPRKSDKAKLPGRPVEYYLDFKKEADRLKYRGTNKIPMETFHEMYFDGDVEFKGDCLEVMEYRHDWASFRFTVSLIKYFLTGMIPELIMHTRSQDEEQVRDHYDRGDDFYGWFLGPRMIYTSGIISDINTEESLEQLQDNKLTVVCEKIELKKGERMLDIGCGWGTLARFASENYGAKVTGITLGRNQTAWGNSAMRKVGIPEEQSKILCMDYRDIPVTEGRYNKITCLEMAEHVGVRHFSSFLTQVYNMLDDDGIFFLQIAGLRKAWQYEDLIWGLFMNKYIFPGADASTPLGFVVDRLEGAGFEVKGVDTIGVHYSATLWKWYRNWMGNRDKVEAKYGKRWFKIWEYFLAYSTIAARQGTATCFQIVLVKNLNSTHRVEGIPSQFGLSGAYDNSEADIKSWAAKNNVASSTAFLS